MSSRTLRLAHALMLVQSSINILITGSYLYLRLPVAFVTIFSRSVEHLEEEVSWRLDNHVEFALAVLFLKNDMSYIVMISALAILLFALACFFNSLHYRTNYILLVYLALIMFWILFMNSGDRIVYGSFVVTFVIGYVCGLLLFLASIFFIYYSSKKYRNIPADGKLA